MENWRENMRTDRICADKLAGPVRSVGERYSPEWMRSASTAHPVQDEDMLNDPVIILINSGEEPQNLPPGI